MRLQFSVIARVWVAALLVHLATLAAAQLTPLEKRFDRTSADATTRALDQLFSAQWWQKDAGLTRLAEISPVFDLLLMELFRERYAEMSPPLMEKLEAELLRLLEVPDENLRMQTLRTLCQAHCPIVKADDAQQDRAFMSTDIPKNSLSAVSGRLLDMWSKSHPTDFLGLVSDQNPTVFRNAVRALQEPRPKEVTTAINHNLRASDIRLQLVAYQFFRGPIQERMDILNDSLFRGSKFAREFAIQQASMYYPNATFKDWKHLSSVSRLALLRRTDPKIKGESADLFALAINDSNEYVRTEAQIVLASTMEMSPQSVAMLSRWTTNRNADVRSAALFRLIQLDSTNLRIWLTIGLRDPNEEIRKRVAEYLPSEPQKFADLIELAAQQNVLKWSPVCGFLAKKPRYTVLEKWATSSVKGFRLSAIAVIQRTTNNRDFRPLLEKLLNDPEKKVAEAAAEVIGYDRSDQAAELIIKRAKLETEDDPLPWIGFLVPNMSPTATKYVESLKNHERRSVRNSVRAYLALLQQSRGGGVSPPNLQR